MNQLHHHSVADPNPLIVVDDVTFRYAGGPEQEATATPALDHVTLRIERGAYVALLGHNGSGKSTLARLVNGLRLPTSGRVLIDGMDTRDATARQSIREQVGMIFSDPDNQIIATVVEDDVAWGLAARGRPRAEITTRVDAALAAVGLTAQRGGPPSDLSGGQRQRLAIAGVLALEPTCIIADEPTALLDPQARVEMVRLLHDLHRTRGITIVHVTHLLEEAALADRVVILDSGRIVRDGTPRAIFDDLAALRRLRLVVPQLAELGERLRNLGLPVPPEAITPESFIEALSALAQTSQNGRLVGLQGGGW